MDKNKKIAVVTGGASGIGAATVKRLVNEGIQTFVLDLKSPAGKKNEMINYIPCDLRDISSVEKAFSVIEKEVSRIDYLILNAGIHYFGTVVETPSEKIEEIIDTNLKGAIYCLKFALPMMEKQGGSSVVIIGSDQSLIGKKNNAIYGATKAALAQLTKSTALDYADKNIRVNCVCPGAIKTPLYDNAVKGHADKYYGGDISKVEEIVRQKHPLGRVGTPKEVANVIWFLCSDQSSFMTGALVSVDGGFTAQ